MRRSEEVTRPGHSGLYTAVATGDTDRLGRVLGVQGRGGRPLELDDGQRAVRWRRWCEWNRPRPFLSRQRQPSTGVGVVFTLHRSTAHSHAPPVHGSEASLVGEGATAGRWLGQAGTTSALGATTRKTQNPPRARVAVPVLFLMPASARRVLCF